MANDRFTIEFDDNALNKFFSTLDRVKAGLQDTQKALDDVQTSAKNINFKISGITNLESLFKTLKGAQGQITDDFSGLVNASSNIKEAANNLAGLNNLQGFENFAKSLERVNTSISGLRGADVNSASSTFLAMSGFFRGVSALTSFIPGRAEFERLTGGFEAIAVSFDVISKTFNDEAFASINTKILTQVAPEVFAQMAILFRATSFATSFIPGENEFDLLTGGFQRIGRSLQSLAEAFGKDLQSNLRTFLIVSVILPLVFTQLSVTFRAVSAITSLIPGQKEFESLGQGFRRIGQSFRDLSVAFGDELPDVLQKVIVFGAVVPFLFTQLTIVFRSISAIASVVPGGSTFDALAENFRKLGIAFRTLSEVFTGKETLQLDQKGRLLRLLSQVVVLGAVVPTIFTILSVVFRSVASALSLLPGGDAFGKIADAFQSLGNGLSKLTELKSLNVGDLLKTIVVLRILSSALKSITQGLVSEGIVDEFSSTANAFQNFGVGVKKIIEANRGVKFTDLFRIFVNLTILGKAIKQLLKVGLTPAEAESFGRFILNVGTGLKNLIEAFKDTDKVRGLKITGVIATVIKVRILLGVLLGAVKRISPDVLEASARVFRALGESLESIFRALSNRVLDKVKIKNVLSTREKIKILKDIFKEVRKFKGGELPDIGSFLNALPQLFEVIADINERGLDTKEARNSVKDIVKILNEFNKVNLKGKNLENIDKVATAIKELARARGDLEKLSGGTGALDSRSIFGSSPRKVGEEAGQDLAGGVRDGVVQADLITDIRRALTNALVRAVSTLNPINIGSAIFNFAGAGLGFVNTAIGKFNELRDAAKQALDDIRDIGENIRDFGDQLLQFGPQALFGSQAFESAIDFDRVGTQLQVFGGLTDEARQQAEQFAFEIGRAYPLSANEALAATLDLVKAGQDLSSVEFILPSAADLAALSDSGNLDTVTGILIAAQAQFTEFGDGIEGSFENIAVASNIIAGAADLSTASVESIGEGLANVGPSASAFGLSLEETSAILAIFDQNAIRGAEGGTALRSVLNALGRPQTVNALRGLGISLFEVGENGQQVRRDFQDVINDIILSLEDMDEAQRAATLQNLADTFGRQGLQILLDQGVDGIEDFVAQLDEVAPASERAQQLLNNLAGDVTQLQGSFETLLTRAMLPLIETFARPFVRALRFIVDGLLTLDDATLAFISTAVALTSIILGAVGGFAVFAGALIQVGAVVLTVGLALINFGAIVLQAVAVITAFGVGLATALVVIPLLVGGIVAITAIFRGFIEGFQEFIAIINQGALQQFQQTLRSLASNARLVFGQILRLFETFNYVLSRDTQNSANIFTTVLSGVFGFISRLASQVDRLARSLFFFLIGFNNFIEGVGLSDLTGNPIIRAILGEGATNDDIANLFDRISLAFFGIARNAAIVKNALSGVLESLFFGGDLNASIGELDRGLRLLSNSLLQLFSSLFNVNTDEIQFAFFNSSFGDGLLALAKAIGGFLFEALLDNRDVIINSITAFFSTFVLPTNAIAGFLRAFGLDAIADGIQAFGVGLTEVFRNTLGTVFNLLEGNDLETALRGAFGAGINSTIAFVEQIGRTLSVALGLFGDLFGGLFLTPQEENQAERGTSVFDFIDGILTSATSALESLTTNVLEPLRTFVQGINFESLRQGLTSIFGGLTEAFGSLVSGDFSSVLSSLGQAGSGIGQALQSIFGQLFDFDPADGDFGTQLLNSIGASIVSALNNLGTFLANSLGIDGETVAGNILALFQPVIDAFEAGDPLTLLSSLLTAITGLLLTGISTAISGIQEITGIDFSSVLTALNTAITALINPDEEGTLNPFSAVGTAIVALLAGAINSAIVGIGELFDIDTEAITTFINGELQETIDSITNLFGGGEDGGGVFANISTTIDNVVAAVTDLFGLGQGEGGGLPSFDNLGPLEDFLATISALPFNVIQVVFDQTALFFDSLANLDQETIQGVLIVLGGIGVVFAGFATGGIAFSAIIPAIIGGLSGLYTAIAPFLGLAAAFFILQAIVQNLNEFADIAERVNEGDYLGALLEFGDALVQIFLDLGVNTANTLADLVGIDFEADKQEIINIVTGLTSQIGLLFRALGRGIGDFFQDMLAGARLTALEVTAALNPTSDQVSRIREQFQAAGGLVLADLFDIRGATDENIAIFAAANADQYIEAFNNQIGALSDQGLTTGEIATNEDFLQSINIADQAGILDRLINQLITTQGAEIALELIPSIVPNLDSANIASTLSTIDFQTQLGTLTVDEQLELLTDISLSTTDESVRIAVEEEIARIQAELANQTGAGQGEGGEADAEVTVTTDVVIEAENVDTSAIADAEPTNESGNTVTTVTTDVEIVPDEVNFDTDSITSTEDVQQLEQDLTDAGIAITEFKDLLLALPASTAPALASLFLFNTLGLIPVNFSMTELATNLSTTVPEASATAVSSLTRVSVTTTLVGLAVNSAKSNIISFRNTMVSSMLIAGSAITLFSIRANSSLETLRQGFIVVISQAQKLVKELGNAAKSANDLAGSVGAGGEGGTTGGRRFGGPTKAGEIYQFLEPGLPFEIFRAQGRNYFFSGVDGEFVSPFASGNKQSLPTGLETQPPRPDLAGSGSSAFNISQGDINIEVNVPTGTDVSNIAPLIGQEVERVLQARDNNFKGTLRTGGRA